MANCQIGVSLAVATSTQHLPLDFALYLPRSWTEDEQRRQKTRIPEDISFETKPELALEMIERAADAGIPGDIILADSAYGDSCDLRNAIRFLGFDYGVGVKPTTNVVRIDASGAVASQPVSIEELSKRLTFRKLTWRAGSKSTMQSRFAFVRVKTTHDDGVDIDDREAVWLVAEQPEEEEAPTKFFLTTLPDRMSRKQTVCVIKERWRTERMYQDLKGELGLDHFEGRSYPGWHHHVSVVIACYAFVVAERARSFSPSASRTRSTRPHFGQARAALRGLLHHRQDSHCADPFHMAPALPTVPSNASSYARTRQTLRRLSLNLRQ